MRLGASVEVFLKAAGFWSIWKAEEAGSNIKGGINNGSDSIDGLSSQSEGQAHKRADSFLLPCLFLLAAARRAPQLEQVFPNQSRQSR